MYAFLASLIVRVPKRKNSFREILEEKKESKDILVIDKDDYKDHEDVEAEPIIMMEVTNELSLSGPDVKINHKAADVKRVNVTNHKIR